MMFTRFTVTFLDLNAKYGYARQLDTPGSTPTKQLIRFDTTKASEIIYFVDPHGIGYSIPSLAVSQRLPELGMELVGSIAHDTSPYPMALDTNGEPFLRNWACADQHDAIVENPVSTMLNTIPEDEDDWFDDEQDEDDYVSTSTIYDRAFAHTGDAELSREAVEHYPGDYM
jgi:hypothetical protein